MNGPIPRNENERNSHGQKEKGELGLKKKKIFAYFRMCSCVIILIKLSGLILEFLMRRRIFFGSIQCEITPTEKIRLKMAKYANFFYVSKNVVANFREILSLERMAQIKIIRLHSRDFIPRNLILWQISQFP